MPLLLFKLDPEVPDSELPLPTSMLSRLLRYKRSLAPILTAPPPLMFSVPLTLKFPGTPAVWSHWEVEPSTFTVPYAPMFE